MIDIEKLADVVSERNRAYRQRDEERAAKEGNIRALNDALVERDQYRAAIEDALKACPSLFHPDPARKVDQVIGILARALKENT